MNNNNTDNNNNNDNNNLRINLKYSVSHHENMPI